MRARSSVVADQAPDRGAHRVDVARLDDVAGLAVGDRLVRPAAAPRDRRDPARGRLEEHDAEALGLEPAPAIAATHREHVGARVERGQVGVGDPAEELHAALRARFSSRPAVAPGARDRELRTVRARRRAADIASITTSKPLRGTSRETPSTSGRSGSRPKRRRVAARVVGVDRMEAVAVDTGRDHHAGQGAARGVGRGARRIRAGRDDRGRAPQHAARRAAGSRACARSPVISLPCATTT